jgi:hypothetical protein
MSKVSTTSQLLPRVSSRRAESGKRSNETLPQDGVHVFNQMLLHARSVCFYSFPTQHHLTPMYQQFKYLAMLCALMGIVLLCHDGFTM